MKTKGIFVILLNMFFLNNLSAATITMRTDLWCPYACDPKSDHPGFMVEIAREVFKKHGHTIDYNVMNWARALADVKSGQYDAVIGASKADVEGFIIPEIPTGNLVNYFWVLKENPWIYSDPKSLDKKHVGVINNYSYAGHIDQLIEKKHSSFQQVSGEAPLHRLIQMTEAKRLDAFIENPLVLSYTLNILKKKKDIFKAASENLSSDPDLFIAFSPAKSTSKEYANILDEGVKELRKNGKLKNILNRYGVSDWK